MSKPSLKLGKNKESPTFFLARIPVLLNGREIGEFDFTTFGNISFHAQGEVKIEIAKEEKK